MVVAAAVVVTADAMVVATAKVAVAATTNMVAVASTKKRGVRVKVASLLGFRTMQTAELPRTLNLRTSQPHT